MIPYEKVAEMQDLLQVTTDNLVKQTEKVEKLASHVQTLTKELNEKKALQDYSEIIDAMISEDQLDPSQRGEKVAELVESGVDPEAIKIALSLNPTIPSFGKLDDNSSGENINTTDPLTRVLLDFKRISN